MWLNNILDTLAIPHSSGLIKSRKICHAPYLPKWNILIGQQHQGPDGGKNAGSSRTEGEIKPGGTIIEGTSGNTGMGLALAACVKGYKCIFTTTDKQSKEKADILKAVGAEVIVCPTNVDPADPRSYYSVSKRLAEEVPNSWYVNQYDNLANRLAHYEQPVRRYGNKRKGKSLTWW